VLVLDRADAKRPALQQAIAAVGLHEVKVDDLPTGKPLRDQLTDELRTVRFVLVVLDKRPIPPSILFEAGLAQGMGAPVAVLDGREPSFGSDPEELALDTLLRAPRLFARIENASGLVQELGAYLEDLDSGPDLVVGYTHIQIKRSPTAEQRSKVWPRYYSEVERRVADAIERAGGTVLTDRPKNLSSPDFAFSFPQLDASMNPVLVEVKQTRHISQTHSQLAEALSRAKAHLGLLVTADHVPIERHRVGSLQVITQISLPELEDKPDVLAKLLTEARNLAVHG
jgi:hypothetical protein